MSSPVLPAQLADGSKGLVVHPLALLLPLGFVGGASRRFK